MFSTLLESRRRRQRGVGATVVSATFHVALVVSAVYATARANEPEAKTEDRPTYTVLKPTEEPPPPRDLKPPPPDAPLPPRGFKVLTAPIDIPLVIPDIDMTVAVTNIDDHVAKGVPGGVANGDTRSRRPVDPGATYHVSQVEKVARLAPGNPEPVYPALLKQTRQTGTVRVSFVIDTTGRAIMETLSVIESAHSLFTDEVKRLLPKYKFVPATIDDVKVRMAVELPFEFKLDPKGGGGL